MHAKKQHKIDLQQNSIWSEKSIYPNPAKFYTSAARTAGNILKVSVSCMRDFKINFNEKANKINAHGDFFYVLQKRRIWLKQTFSILFYTLIRNP